MDPAAASLRKSPNHTIQRSPWRRYASTIFLATTTLQLAVFEWSQRWILSGAPILTFFLLCGDKRGRHVLPSWHIWTLFTTLNLTYAVASTSWLLYWTFTACCYPAIYVTCLFQYKTVGEMTRWMLRGFWKELHFIDDKIALFNIPALQIDTDVDGLLVLRGITLSFSTLSFTVHGVEVGIRLAEDLELAIQTERVVVSLFRKIDVYDCFVNIKNGEQEAEIGKFPSKPKEDRKGSSAKTDTPSINAATNENRPASETKAKLTAGNAPKDSSHSAAYKAIKKQSLHSDAAIKRYQHTLELLDASNTINQAKSYVQQRPITKTSPVCHDESALRAAICSQLHSKPSVPNPPLHSIKVTSLREWLSPGIRRFLHRLPMLLRLLLNPLSYLHPVTIRSITATASGDWIKSLLVQKIFKSEDSSEIDLERLRADILSWVTGAHFTVGLGPMTGQSHVPMLSSSKIFCRMAFDGAMGYRAHAKDMSICEIVKLRGLDASFVVPMCLLPHHEHIIPDKANVEASSTSYKPDATSDSSDKAHDDTIAVNMAVRAHLPATLDQDILNFITLIAKHCKLIEMDHSPGPLHDEVKGFVEFTGAVNHKIKDGMKKVVMGGDQWLAKLAGKALKKLQGLNGDLGYSGDISVDLSKYRLTGWLEAEGEKLLP